MTKHVNLEAVRERERERERELHFSDRKCSSVKQFDTCKFVKNKKGYRAYSLDIKNKLLAMCNISMANSLFFVFAKTLRLRGLHLHNTIVKYNKIKLKT